ncbi:hypothetical protein, conserved [Trypanosoma cruzi]|uniref:Uncharacterized protein n=2 Tax=Trypanosoma cruzi TaxID=5693 RepID=Q4E107_TRYCC|nr:hypothetical protein, conserved [Trypanosoma cruzi]EAN98460.1 hypothetical protein, conserved [Trypanosoma cruzi]|eukprot:XP_820311.1 hypothetical protein [Trypanosoma cruzi strain CL Brener]
MLSFFRLLVLCSLVMSLWTGKDATHTRSICVALGIVLGFCIFSYTSVWNKRRKRAGHVAESSEQSVTPKGRGTSGHTTYGPPQCANELQSQTLSGGNTQRERQSLWRTSSAREEYKKTPTSQTETTPLFLSTVKHSGGCSANVGSTIFLEKPSSTLGFDSEVVVGHFAMCMAGCFTQESVMYRFPIEIKRYVHVDGSIITLVAEDLGNVEVSMTTESYKTRCIERAREEAVQQQTYFKVQHDTLASDIVTTVMEQYACIYIGPSPMVTLSFFLVQNHIAYVFQLQSHANDYGLHLTDFLYTIQSVRIEKYPRVVSGKVRHALISNLGGEAYLVDLPPQFIVTCTKVTDFLSLHYRHANAWSGEVLTWAPKKKNASNQGNGNHSSNANHDVNNVITLIPGKLFIVSHWQSNSEVSATVMDEVKGLLEAVSAFLTKIVGKQLPSSLYVSSDLEMPLPPIQCFTTNVCTHTADPFITMFVLTKDAGIFELEVGALEVSGITELTHRLNCNFSKSLRLHHGETASGKRKLTFSGESEKNMMFRLDAVHSSYDDLWFTIKCLHVSGTKLPGDLLQYLESALDALSFPPNSRSFFPIVLAN